MALKKQKSSSPKKPVIRLKLWQYMLLFAVPLLVFGRSALFGYVMHDDDKMILENPAIEQGFNLRTAFTTDAWFMDARIELYRPWQSASYMLDYMIAKESPVVYHVHNLILLLLGTGLLFLFLKSYFSPLLAWAGALLYSVNLLNPHTVGWIAARGDLYLMVYGLAFLVLLRRYQLTHAAKYLWYSVPLFLLALFSKESAIALLPVSFVMLYTERRKLPVTKEWIWLAINVACFIGYFALRAPAIADAGNLSATAFFSNLRSIAEESFKMIIPLGFSVMPGYSLFWTLGGVVVLAVLAYLVVKYKPSKEMVWVGLAIWLGSLLPSMAYEPSFAGVAYDYLDHRSWFPFSGLLLIVLAIADKAKWASARNSTYIFAGMILVWSGINAWRVGVYEGWEPYYQNAITTNPGSGLANLNFGSMLRDNGKWDEALPYMEKGAQLSPDYTDAKIRLAEAYFKANKYQQAIDVATEALMKEPNNVMALQFRGSAYGASGRTDVAAEDFKRILDLDPENPHGMFNLGVAYKEANMLNQAVEVLSRLLVLQPDFPNAYFERGFCYGKMGLFPQAKADLEQSILTQPEHGVSYFFLGRTFEALGGIESACANWKKALELGVKDAEPYLFEKCQAYK